MQPKNLLLAWAFATAASADIAEQQAIPDVSIHDVSSQTHEQKTSIAKTILKISSDGKASAIPEIAKLAIGVSGISTISEEDAISRLGLSTLQVEFLLDGHQAADILDTYTGTSTRVDNDKDDPYLFNRQAVSAKEAQPEGAVHVIKYKADITYNARSKFVKDIQEIRNVMGQLRKMEDVKVRAIEWELSEASKERIRVEAKKEAMKKCVSRAQETASILGLEEVMLMEVEEAWIEVREKREMRDGRYYISRAGGTEIDTRPKEMEMDVRMSCTFGIA
jgi:uncharacterized protein YggE